MRSVVFADEKVVDALNKEFVLAWNNHAPEWGGGGKRALQPVFSKEELALYPEGGGGGNIRTYICRPEGAIVHYLEGWFRPERYLGEVEFARTLVKEEKPAARLAEHAKELQAAQQELARKHPEEMSKEFAASEIRRLHAAIGLLIRTQGLAQQVALRPIDKVIAEVVEQNSDRGIIK
jgi:hypothetical protein